MNFAPSQQILLLKGTLIVDVLDKQTGRMIWRSVATSYLEKKPSIDRGKLCQRCGDRSEKVSSKEKQVRVFIA